MHSFVSNNASLTNLSRKETRRTGLESRLVTRGLVVSRVDKSLVSEDERERERERVESRGREREVLIVVVLLLNRRLPAS